MVNRLILVLVLGVVTLTGASVAGAADMKPIHTQRTKDLLVTLESEAGQWKQGKNVFVVAFTSAKDKQPVDAGKVTVNTSMTMSGMAPMIAGATLTPERTPGRYAGTITFSDSGTRQVTVMWDGPAGKGSTKFSVPVR